MKNICAEVTQPTFRKHEETLVIIKKHHLDNKVIFQINNSFVKYHLIQEISVKVIGITDDQFNKTHDVSPLNKCIQ